MVFIVISIEGIHGSGKTHLVKELACKYKRKKENFESKNPLDIDPQCFFKELTWGMRWFNDIVNMCSKISESESEEKEEDDGIHIILTDRSPYSACIYSKTNADLLEKTLTLCVEELRRKDIYIYTINLFGSYDFIKERIKKRLETETWRKDLKEDSKAHFFNIKKRYRHISNTWDYNVNIEQGNPKDEVEDIIKEIKTIHQ